MTNKMNRVDALNLAIAALSDNAAAVETLTNIRESIAKANARRSDKPTKAQVENARLAAIAVEAVQNMGKPVSVSEVLAAVPEFAGMSNQKVSALLNKAVADGSLLKTSEKRVTKFLAVA